MWLKTQATIFTLLRYYTFRLILWFARNSLAGSRFFSILIKRLEFDHRTIEKFSKDKENVSGNINNICWFARVWGRYSWFSKFRYFEYKRFFISSVSNKIPQQSFDICLYKNSCHWNILPLSYLLLKMRYTIAINQRRTSRLYEITMASAITIQNVIQLS